MAWGLPHFDFAVQFAGVSHAGPVRGNNEDAWRVDMASGAFVVADGMGGHAAGEVASNVATDTFIACMRDSQVGSTFAAYRASPSLEGRQRVLDVMRWGVERAHDAVRSEAARDRARDGMGCTLDAILLIGARAFLVHVGDGRVYLTRPTATIQLTNDHTIGGSLVARGMETPTKPPPPRDALVSVIGSKGSLKIDEISTDVTQGDRLTLCTDGVYGPLGDEPTLQQIAREGDGDAAAYALVQGALERGGKDNATALVVDVSERTADQVPGDGGLAQRDFAYASQCTLFSGLDAQHIGRALSATVEVSFAEGDLIPRFFTSDRVAYVLLEGEAATEDGWALGASALVYPESLAGGGTKGSPQCTATQPVRALRIRADDFREVCSTDVYLAAVLYERIARTLARR